MDVQLPIDTWHVLLAMGPIAALLLLLLGLSWGAPRAGLVAMAVAAGVAWLGFRVPPDTLAVAAGKGLWDAAFVLYVVWPALLFYHVTSRAGAFEALRVGIGRITGQQLFLVLAFGWVFASFLQGVAGFGAPVAVVAPLLVALGVRPVAAVAIPLIGHSWASIFGTLALGWLATLRVVELAQPAAAAFQAALLIWIPDLTAGLAIAAIAGGRAAIRRAWPLVLAVSALHGGLQLAIAPWNAPLSALLASTAAMLALYPLSRARRFQERDATGNPASSAAPQPAMGFGMAVLPYALLTASAVSVLLVPPIESFLARVEVGFAFPAVGTGYGVAHAAERPYSPFAPLTHPGSFLLVAALATGLIYRARGFYAAWARRAPGQVSGTLWGRVLGDAAPASLAIMAFLVMSKLMDHAGQTQVLALALAQAAPPLVFALAANGIGVLGAFLTSSATASNILFAPLQDTIAQAEPALEQATLIAAQSAGAATGNAMGPANVVLGTGTAGIAGQEGAVLRHVLPWVGVTALLTGLATLAIVVLAP